MTHTNTPRQVEIFSHNLPDLLSLLNQSKRPVILTAEGRGVAAIIPYIDAATIQERTKVKKHGHRI
jgi:hypothetical protein